MRMQQVQVMEKRWKITQNQWQILLSQYGKNIGYGMYFPKEEQGKSQVIEELYRMVKIGILLVEGEKLAIADEYRKLLEICAKAERGCFLEDKEEEEKIFFYMGEDCVICESSSNQKNCFVFSIKKREKLLSYFLEIGFFPRYQIENDRENNEDYQVSILEKESQELPGNGRVEKIATFFDLKKEEQTARLLISREEGEEYLVWEEKDRRGKRLLSEKNLKEIWKEFVEDAACGSGSTCI